MSVAVHDLVVRRRYSDRDPTIQQTGLFHYHLQQLRQYSVFNNAFRLYP